MIARNNDLDISHAKVGNEIKRRAPWMVIGLVAGVAMILVGRGFEQALLKRIELVFFIPMIVYMSDCIGTETLALFVRELALRRLSLKKLLWREAQVGMFLGLVSGVPMGAFAYWWLRDLKLTVVIGLTMVVNGLVAVLVGMLTPIIFAKLKRDPALGTDAITTAVSDNLSMLIYLVVATVMLF